MLLNEIKEYLQSTHLELDQKVLTELELEKERAICNQDEPLANEAWCLIETYNIQKKYLDMFCDLKHGDYENAWQIMDDIDITIGYLRVNFGDGINQYSLPLINNMIKNYEVVYPNYIFMSRESVIKEEKCSICGKVASLRGGCKHIPGKLYMGELCLREVTDLEIIGMALVKHPLDKYAIMKVEGQEYNYGILDELMKKIESPFIPWHVDQVERKKPEYLHIGRNDRCPCGSGKKYKKCCINTAREHETHYKITIGFR